MRLTSSFTLLSLSAVDPSGRMIKTEQFRVDAEQSRTIEGLTPYSSFLIPYSLLSAPQHMVPSFHISFDNKGSFV
jgi:hypothetical protein